MAKKPSDTEIAINKGLEAGRGNLKALQAEQEKIKQAWKTASDGMIRGLTALRDQPGSQVSFEVKLMNPETENSLIFTNVIGPNGGQLVAEVTHGGEIALLDLSKERPKPGHCMFAYRPLKTADKNEAIEYISKMAAQKGLVP
jgi:hypothetical protein